MSLATASSTHPVRQRVGRAAPRAPLVTHRQQRVMLLLGVLLLGGGVAAGVVALLRPAPRPQFVGLWILSDPSQHGQRQAALERDRAALVDGQHFERTSALPVGTPTLRQVQAQLAELQTLRARDSVVLYVAASATVDDRGRVQLPLGSTAARDSLALRDVLATLRDSPARRKLLVLDLARDEDDAIWPHPTGEVAAAIETELSRVADPRRLVITACSPGETPRVCEVHGRSLFGASFEHALSGAADGALDRRRNGRVSVGEIAAFVSGEVARQAAALQDAAQTPRFIGDGEVFDLTTVSLRQHRKRKAAAQPLAARAYPKWLAAAWAQRDQLALTGAFDDAPRMQRRWEQTLLRAEGQWRGGRDAKAVERDLTQHMANLTREMQQCAAAVPSPTAHSLAALRAGHESKDLAAASKAVADLAAAIEAKTLGLPSDKSAAVRVGLLQGFLDKTQKLDADAFAIAVVDRLAADDEPTAADVQLADQLLRARTPQPAYVETLLVRRLTTALTLDSSLSPELIAEALRVQQKGEQALLPGRSFAWASADATRAAQERYDGEYLLLHPGLAPAALAGQRLAAAERSLDRVVAVRAAIDQAYRALAAGGLRLPAAFNHLPATRAAQSNWLVAANATTELAALLRLPQHSPSGEHNQCGDIERVRTLTVKLTAALDELHRPLTGERLDRLTSADEHTDPSASWSALAQALEWPGLLAADRQRLWTSFEALNISLCSACESSTATVLPGGDDQRPPPRAAAVNSADELFTARSALTLLRLGGVEEQQLAALDKQLRELADAYAAGKPVPTSTVRALRQALRAEYQRVLGGELADADAWTCSRAACIVPSLREFAWLDALDRDPTIAVRRDIDAARWRWLAAEFRYRAHDDTTQLNSQLARRYESLASNTSDRFIRFAEAQPLARPTPASPESTALVRWDAVGSFADAVGSGDLTIFTPGTGIAALVQETGAPGEATIKVRGSAAGDELVGHGLLVELVAGGRTWHQPLEFTGGSSTALDVLLASSADGEAVDFLHVRPAATPQPYFLAVKNPTSAAQQVIVEIPGIGQTMLSVPAGQTTPVRFPPAPPQPGASPTMLDGSLQVMLRDAATSQALFTKSFSIEVVSPAQYVRVLETRFDPGVGEKNRLSVTLAASMLPAGPPCMVELVLSPDAIPGLVGVTGGRLRGELLPDGTSLTLTAEGLRLVDGADEQGEFALNIDGVERAMTFAADFARRGDATTPRQVARPTISLTAPAFALAGPNFQPTAHVTQGPATGRIELRMGPMENGVLVSQLSQTVASPREAIISLIPSAGNTLALMVGVRDWRFAFDATGIVGPRTVEAALVNDAGRRLAVARQSVTFDGTPPESAAFFQLPREVLVNVPIDLQVLAADSVSGIDKVFVFAGRTVDGQPPPGAQLIEAKRASGGGTWHAQLPPAKDLGPCDIGVQAVNRVGLATCTSDTVQIVAQLATVGSSIAGTVVEGNRPQPQLEVQLHDASSAVIATVKSDVQGAFLFTDLKPGNYKLTTTKTTSQRRAETAVALEQGQAARVQLELSL